MEAADSIEDGLKKVPNGDPATYCRLCLSDIDVEALFPDGQGARQDLIDRIHECTTIQITIDEDYASSICWMCSITLEEFQCFRDRCHRYDVLIRQKRREKQLTVGVEPMADAVIADFHVSMEDDNSFDDYDGELDQDGDPDGPGLLQITSVQESVETDSDESLLEATAYEPYEKDLKPDQETLVAYAEHFKASDGGYEIRDSTPDDELRRFKCNMCTRSFKNRANLWEHNRLHSGKLPFACNDCGTTFSRVKSLMAHQNKYHSKNSTEDPPLSLKCNFCPRVFPRKGDRTQHMKMGHPDLYNPNDSLETPSPVISRERSTPATVSTPDSQIVSVAAKKKPFLSNTPTPSPVSDSGATRFCCNMCTKSFQSVQQLEDHIGLMHPKDGVLKCSLCPKIFKSKQTLRMHILNHQGKLPYKCDECGSRFDRRFYLQKHRDKYHGEDSKALHCRYRCKFCPRIFHRKIDRKTHTRMVHAKEIKVKKEKIDQTLSAIEYSAKDDSDDQAPLTTPIATSSQNMGFSCMHCGEQFPTPAMLKEHCDDQHSKKVEQNDVKPILTIRQPTLATKLEKKIVPARSTLNVRRPYKCPYCPKTFTQKYVMKEHTFIHTGSLRYRCDECMAMFNRPHYLRAHKMKYHGQNSKFKPLKCRFCTRSFVRKQDIKIHERIAHGITGLSTARAATKVECNGSENVDHEVEADSEVDIDDDDDLGEEVSEDDGGLDKTIEDEDDVEADGEDINEESSHGDPEIRDVVVTLERIPEDILQSLDNTHENESSNEQESAVSASSTPRLGVGITLHRCPKCLKVFKTRKSLKHHMIYHQNQLPFSCDECGVQFARNRPLQIHKQRYHSEDAPYTGKRFSCDYCPRIFLRERDKLFHHKTVHSFERNYGPRDENTPELKKSKIKRRKDYICVLCCERFETEKSCQRHINEFHPAETLLKTTAESPACSDIATTKQDPGSDSNTIIPSSPSHVSPSKGAPTGSGIKPYKLCRCTTCVSIFKNRENWSEHINSHSNVRPHHCEPCLIKRKSRSNRKVTSVGFKCQYCPKVFTKASSLITHQRLHTSELRFPCDECGMMYDRYRLLQTHKERYHSEDSLQYPALVTFRCSFCPRTFMRLRDRNFHQESVHAT